MNFPHVYLNFTDQKTISSLFYHQFKLCHPTRVIIYLALIDTRLELKCNSFCTSDRVAIDNHLNRFQLFKTI